MTAANALAQPDRAGGRVVAAAFLLWTPARATAAPLSWALTLLAAVRAGRRRSCAELEAAARAGRSRSPAPRSRSRSPSLFATLYPNVHAVVDRPRRTASPIDQRLEHPLHAQGDDRGSRSSSTPVVLLYQAWTYWVFRKRISNHHIPAAQSLVPAARSSAEPSGTTAS